MQRQKGVALWRQISDRIRANILTGLYDKTGMVPAETALAEEFGVNRHTVRAALAALAQEGIVRAAQGRGTMITQRDKFDFPIGRRTRFSEGIGEQARDLKGILLSSAREIASADLVKRLKLNPGDEVLRLDGIRKADGRAVSRSTMWFPAERFAGIDTAFAETGSITRALSRCGVDDYVREVTEISAVHAEPDDVVHLELTPGAIVLVTRALNTDPAGCPIQYAVTRFPADRVQFTIRN
ncbi:MAG: phosphonate metabolism transcriptional regulator PhnF [Alphaproteobacteria bacterium]|uniref:phosphonate metabolism transcriptional regulator PhnF n=1 Tax=Rhizobium/Agrobacterium group TaxID=227290 RepID=UPI0006B951D1|nr:MULTISPECIES: phosphonate metabolism transcriptional regulator PhnF [Rhizobium/Agrobacterium group]MBU0739094.1 phosphonate metabolism transcriptional regulator PhnF [Alphaproteobacteria bacterium]MDM7980561.1 phosphonate metabolism transcriptional regulator PhnF [Rhizobium sp.]AOG10280.1 phosphonate metabolism transcriptional regulator PhnF [Agrobacterium sp. RAC06]KPF57102.1 phosphonate metabolism transcriptional regulator PhnF [Rhizobium sp. AAP116]MBU0832795.1 phosphonate metabolism tra